MSPRDEDTLSENERLALAALPEEEAPPEGLEERICRDLARRGLLDPVRRMPRRRWLRGGLAAAAALALVLLGGVIGRWQSGDWPAGQTYLLLLMADPALAAEEGERRASAIGAWAAGLQARGVAIQGEELAPPSWVVRPGGEVEVPSNVQRVGSTAQGFFLVEAESSQQAIAIAADCPFLTAGRSIVVRAIMR